MTSYTKYHKRYYKADPERARARAKAWRKNNRVKYLSYQRQYNLTRKTK